MDQIGQYRVIRLLGEGGMGKVYLGEERLTGRKVALKLLHQELALAERQRARFVQEMAILTRLDHPNVVRCLSCIEHEGQLCMVMELLEGHTLRDELERRPRLAPAEVIALASHIAAALSAAHQSQPPIIHRDLKPENVMLLAAGGVKVMDFGIAKVKSDTAHSTQVMGTIAYMSPEQIDAQPVDARSDLYNLGLICYEALAGAHPFASDSPRQLLNAQCTEPPPALHPSIRATLPAGFEELLLQLLEKRPAARPESAAAVCARLAGLGPGSPVVAAVPSRAPAAAHHSTAQLIAPLEVTKARRPPAWLGLAGALGLAATAAAAFVVLSAERTPPPAPVASPPPAVLSGAPPPGRTAEPQRIRPAPGPAPALAPAAAAAAGTAALASPPPPPALPRAASSSARRASDARAATTAGSRERSAPATTPAAPAQQAAAPAQASAPKPSTTSEPDTAAPPKGGRPAPDRMLGYAIERAIHQAGDLKECFFESVTLLNHGTFPMHWDLTIRFTGTRVDSYRIEGKVSAELERLRFKELRTDPVTQADVDPVERRIKKCLDAVIRKMVMPETDAAGTLVLKFSDWDMYTVASP